MAQNSSVSAASLVTMPVRPFANENNPSEVRHAPVSRRARLAERFLDAVQWAERRISANAIHGNPPIYDSALFPWVDELERNWTTIRGELAQLMMRRDALSSRRERSSPTVGQDRAWTTFELASYYRRNEHHIRQCPETWRIVQCVPRLVSVMFSVLEPGARLPAHYGPYNGLLRLHLGLIVPEPREAVAIRIDGAVHHWEEGRSLIFDDTFEHEARNESGHTRVVLFIDFERPLRLSARLLNRSLLRNRFFSPFVREGVEDQGRWARLFYREAQALRADRRAAAVVPEHVSASATGEHARALAESFERDWPAEQTRG